MPVPLDPALGRELCRIHGQDQVLLQDAESHCCGLSLGAAHGTLVQREHLVGLGLEMEQK